MTKFFKNFFDLYHTSSYIGQINEKMEQIEKDILIKCREGDKDAFRQVVRQYQRMVFSLALKMLCDEEEAKDTVQDTFIRVWQNIGEYDTAKSFVTWIYTIATRLCLDRIKAKKHTASMPEDVDALARFAADTDSQVNLENSEWVAIVRLLASRLSDKQKTVFTLCQLEGLDTDEVQRITGLDATQIKSNLYVARQTIRKQLTELGYE
jgi:RNA polymerase sigma-70 factor (ECF subfamily)